MKGAKEHNPRVKRCSKCSNATTKGENYECSNFDGQGGKVTIAKSLGKRQAVCDNRITEVEQ